MVYQRRYKRMVRKRSLGRTRKYPSYAIKRYVKQQLNKNIEMKLRQYTFNSVGINPVSLSAETFATFGYGGSSSVAGLCAGVANGTGEGQRIGNSIRVRGCQINLALVNGDNSNYTRILLVSPKKQYDYSSIANFIQQLLSNQSSSSTQWLQPVDTDVWRVHMDKRIYYHNVPYDGATAASVPQTRFVKKFIKFNKKVRWQLSAPILPTTDLYLVALSDSSVVAHPGAAAGFVKIWYQDA